MKFQKLGIADFVKLAVVILLAYLYISVDQLFVPVSFRPIAVLIVILGLLLGFFLLVKPKTVIHLSNSLLVSMGGIATLIILIQHVIIRFDFNVKVLMILLIVCASLTYPDFYIFF